jgi:hypothetical protein
MAIYASRGSGKTFFTVNLIKNQLEKIYKPFRRLVWIYKHPQQEVFNELSSNIDLDIEFVQTIPDFSTWEKQENTLVVLDDFMSEASHDVQVSGLFTDGRHKNVSVIFLAQNLFHRGKHSRDIALNSDYIALFKNVRDKTQIQNLARQMYPGNVPFLMWAYTEATKDNFGYLFLDLKPYTEDRLRVRSDILNWYQTIYEMV